MTRHITSQKSTNGSTWILDYVRSYENFPAKGVQFQWYAKLLLNPEAFKRAINEFADRYRKIPIDAVAALETRGFLIAAPLAIELNLPLILIRKSGKLPGDVDKISYKLEYGSDSFEIEKLLIKPHQKVLIVDDVLATGESAAASVKLIERQNAEVLEIACMIEITHLKGREKLNSSVFSLVAVD